MVSPKRSRISHYTQYANPDALHQRVIPMLVHFTAFHKAKSNGSFFL